MIRYYGRQRRQLSPEETAANAKARADRAAASMTCQCCGKRYLANTGTVAHHGYQRPGGGWQTSSCSGAKYLPFQVDRAQLGVLIVGLKNWEDHAARMLAKVEAEQAAIGLDVPDYSQRLDAYGHRPSKHIEVTRATFEAIRAAERNYFLRHSLQTFDDVKGRDVRHRQSELNGVRLEIKAQQARFDGWTQTHEWDASTRTWKDFAG